MDSLTRAFYELVFQVAYLEKKGNEFQDFFSSIMEKSHPGDFQRIRPWGNLGDQKCDGYLKSEKRLFAVYAPNEMAASEALTKINSDFEGALPHWQEYIEKWTFVHNSRLGLGPTVQKALLDLEKGRNGLSIAQWGFEELRQKVFILDYQDLASLLGAAPTTRDFLDMSFEDLRNIISQVALTAPVIDAEIHPVPSDKLSANGLSSDVQVLLTAGMRKSDRVRIMINGWHDPLLGDRLAARFRDEYSKLKESGYPPDQIFGALHHFTGGLRRKSPSEEAAVLAVLAFLFEKCEIFEAPPQSATTS